jgi:hypothetical protein
MPFGALKGQNAFFFLSWFFFHQFFLITLQRMQATSILN